MYIVGLSAYVCLVPLERLGLELLMVASHMALGVKPRCPGRAASILN